MFLNVQSLAEEEEEEDALLTNLAQALAASKEQQSDDLEEEKDENSENSKLQAALEELNSESNSESANMDEYEAYLNKIQKEYMEKKLLEKLLKKNSAEATY